MIPARLIARIAGEYRMPALLQRADQLSRGLR